MNSAAPDALSLFTNPRENGKILKNCNDIKVKFRKYQMKRPSRKSRDYLTPHVRENIRRSFLDLGHVLETKGIFQPSEVPGYEDIVDEREEIPRLTHKVILAIIKAGPWQAGLNDIFEAIEKIGGRIAKLEEQIAGSDSMTDIGKDTLELLRNVANKLSRLEGVVQEISKQTSRIPNIEAKLWWVIGVGAAVVVLVPGVAAITAVVLGSFNAVGGP